MYIMCQVCRLYNIWTSTTCVHLNCFMLTKHTIPKACTCTYIACALKKLSLLGHRSVKRWGQQGKGKRENVTKRWW